MRWLFAFCLTAALPGCGSVSGESTDASTDATADLAVEAAPEAAIDSVVVSDAGCPTGSTASWSKPGCDLLPDSCFDPTDACAAESTVCGCDGKLWIAPCGQSPVPWTTSGCKDSGPPITACPPITTSCTLAERVFPYDVAGKCTHCAVEAVCTPEGCATSPACWVRLSTGAMHYTLNDCTPEVTAAGFRKCTAEEVKLLPMSTTWPPPPMCP